MSIFQLFSTYLQYYLPINFYNFLNLTSSYWTKIIGAIAIILLGRTIIVFFRSQKKWPKNHTININDIQNIAKTKNKPLPYFSILVPARNEADVVAKTIYKLTTLNYPKNKFEIIIITDQKETLQKHKSTQINTQINVDTTQEVVHKTIKELKHTKPEINIINLDVPYDFDGKFGGKCLGQEVKSTKGRALNFALTELKEHFEEKTNFFAFFDTDDHPDSNCLLHIAKANLLDQTKKVFQLPVYQCRNFWHISAFSKVVCLSQSFTHENFLPWIMTWLPFLGGTNLYVQKDILFAVNGFNYNSITEDLDLGITIFLKTKTWPHFLPVPSSEQTPPNMKAYFKQRKRWAMGQLEVMNNLKNMIKNKEGDPKIIKDLYKKLWLYGPAESTLFFLLTISSFLVLVSRIIKGIFLIITLQSLAVYFSPAFTLRETLYAMASIVGIPMIIFSLILLHRYKKYIETPKSKLFQAWELIKFILMEGIVIPLVLFVYPLPFFVALVEHSLGMYKNKELVWVKTPRTQEK